MLKIWVCAALAAQGSLGAGEPDCTPSLEMMNSATSIGYEIVAGESVPENPYSCGDLNDDGKVDLCTILVKRPDEWAAVCFLSRGKALKVEKIADSSEQGLKTIAPSELGLDVVRKGETLDWAHSAAQIRLQRDCLLFGVKESAHYLYCFNGATLLSAQMSD